MAVGLSAANVANKLLAVLGQTGTTFTAENMKVQIHTADPGSIGTTAVSTGNATKQTLTFGTSGNPSGGSMSITASPTAWSITLSGSTTENITHISLWGATTGNFLWSIALASPKTVNNGDSLQLTSLTLALTPIAA